MAIAGKVAITPKGEWNAQTAYTKLDLVFYDNASYVAIQPSTGVEPTNTSYWMLIVQSAGGADLDGIINGDIQVGNAKTLDGHEAEYFASKEELCSLPMQVASLSKNGWYRVATFDTSSNAYGCIVSLGNGYGSGGGTSFALAFNGSHGKNVITQLSGAFTGGMPVDKVRCVSDGDYKTHIEIHYSKDVSNRVYVHVGNIWVRNSAVRVPFTEGEIPEGYTVTEFELVGDYTPIHKGNYSEYALPNTGGEISANAFEPIKVNNTNASSSGVCIWYSLRGNHLGDLGFWGKDRPVFYPTDGSGVKDLLHTGNKPTGTYTGNGSATERTIATGSSFPYYIISSSNGILIVTPDGCFGSDGTTTIRDSRAYSSGSNIVVKSSSPLLNAEGVTYKYLTL